MANIKLLQLATFLFCFVAATAIMPCGSARAVEGDVATTTTTTTAPAKAVHHAKKAVKKAAKAEASADAQYVAGGEKTCLQCHETTNTVMEIFQTPHGQKGDPRTPAAAHECETCHGSGANHINGPERGNIGVVFTKHSPTPVAEQNKMCLACHENGARMNWQGSQHMSADVACASCHTIHVKKDPVLVKASQPEKCFTCHAEQRAQSYEFSHHPMREGKVACSDCHNPHGTSGPKLLKENNVNDTCYTCHTDKRGPFLWEHQPVREDCTNCHVPHGSNQARLLKERAPFLCNNCHTGSSHFAGDFNANNLPLHNDGIVPAIPANKTNLSARMLARGCVNCHSAIHGSNSPAGQFFNR